VSVGEENPRQRKPACDHSRERQQIGPGRFEFASIVDRTQSSTDESVLIGLEFGS